MLVKDLTDQLSNFAPDLEVVIVDSPNSEHYAERLGSVTLTKQVRYKSGEWAPAEWHSSHCAASERSKVVPVEAVLLRPVTKIESGGSDGEFRGH